MPDNWNAKRLDESQTAMFDVVMGEIVPSLKSVDQERFTVELTSQGFVVVDVTGEVVAGVFAARYRAQLAAERMAENG